MKLSLDQVFPALKEKKYGAYVLYGHNTALIQGIKQEIDGAFSQESLSVDRLIQEGEEICAPRLFGTRTEVFHLHGNLQWPLVGPRLAAWPRECPIVTNCPSFSLPWSKSPKIAAVACYHCTSSESKTILRRHLMREGLHLQEAVLEWCAEFTRCGSWNTLVNLLSLTADGGEALNVDQLSQMFVTMTPEANLAILEGGDWDLAGLEEDPLKILRSWQRSLVQLWQLKQLLPHQGAESAVETLRPVVFFKHKALLVHTAKKWSSARILRCLGQLVQAETTLKKSPLEARDLLQRLLRLR